MQITVYGATGTFGRRLTEQLRGKGHSVIAAHRGSGVDTYHGKGVTEAAEGSDVLVDCVNFMTNNRHKALDFFSRSSRSIAMAAAENPGAAVACLSIAFRPEVARSSILGYYQGKAMQERIYQRLVPSDQLLMFRSAQWFELVETMTTRIGPVAMVPKMRVRALAAEEASRMMAEAIDAGERGTIEAAGPEISDFPTIAKKIAASAASRSAQSSRATTIVPIPLPGPLSGEGLIPESPRLSDTTVDEWLRMR